MAFSKKGAPEQIAPAAQESSKSSGESMMQGSIKSLIGAGKNVACDITYKDGKGTAKIFVADKKFRGDFDMITNAKEYKSHMIQDGTNAYMWSDDNKQGTKFSVEAMMKVAVSPSPRAQQGADLNADVDLKCANGSQDSSKFVPPADVSFRDMSAMMDKMTGGSGAPKTDVSACASITDAAAKAACVSAMSK